MKTMITDYYRLPNGESPAVGVRLKRLSDGRWLDPGTREWRTTPPVALWEAEPMEQAYGPEAAGTSLADARILQGQFLVELPAELTSEPGEYLIVPFRVAGQPGLEASYAMGPLSNPPGLIRVQPAGVIEGHLTIPVTITQRK